AVENSCRPLYGLYTAFNDLLTGTMARWAGSCARLEPRTVPVLLTAHLPVWQRRDGMSLQAFDALQFPRNQRQKGKAPQPAGLLGASAAGSPGHSQTARRRDSDIPWR